MKIAFSPYSDIENKYINIITDILESIEGVHVVAFHLKHFLMRSKNIRKSKIVWFNWYESADNTFLAAIRLLVIIVLKASGKKIIYTLHNKGSHGSKNVPLSGLLQKSLFFFAQKIVIHCNASVDEIPVEYHTKVINIPHPHYIGVYGEKKTGMPGTGTRLRLLFIGQVKPYKNIELLINVVSRFAPHDVELIIAGKPVDKGYKRELEHLNKKPHIKLVFKFIEDKDISVYLSECDLLVLPYDLRSSLNSGSVILAFSYSRTVICPLIGTLEDMDQTYYLTYTYHDEAEHRKSLTRKIQEAIEMKKKDVSVFNRWGEAMYKEMEQRNSYNKIKKTLETMLSNI